MKKVIKKNLPKKKINVEHFTLVKQTYNQTSTISQYPSIKYS